MMKEEEEKELKLKEARKKKKLKSKVEGEGSTSPDRSESQSPINLKLTNLATSSVKSKPRYSIKHKETQNENVLGDSEDGSGRKELTLEEVQATDTKKGFKLTGTCSVKLDASNTYKVPNELIRNRIKSEPLGWMNYLDIEKTAME